MSSSDEDYLPAAGSDGDEYEFVDDDDEEDTSSSSSSSSSSDDDGDAPAARRSARLAGRGGGAPTSTPPSPPHRPPPPVAATPLAQEVSLHSSARLPDEAVTGPATPGLPAPPPPAAVALLRAREAALTGFRPGWAPCQRAHLAGNAFAPRAPAAVVDAMHSRAYVGFFSPSGNKFVAGFQQDRRLRVYDSSPSAGPAIGAATAAPPGRPSGPSSRSGVVPAYPLLKDVECRLLRWTITDVALSPDEALAAYASINPVAHVVRLEGGAVESVANTTDVHAACPLDEVAGAPPDARLPPFGVWALRFAPNGGGAASSTLVAGGAGGRVYLHDVAQAKTTDVLRVHGEDWDVNALAFLDAHRPHVFATGADDGLVKIVDTRVGGGGGGRSGGGNGRLPLSPTEASAGTGGSPVALLAGHLAGITFLDARGDGHTLLSNSKDQTAKLWDVRRGSAGGGGGGANCGPGSAAEEAALAPVAAAGGLAFDYRWDVPRRLARSVHPADGSVATYRGHAVLATLIRARFSPPGPTGGAFIYAGSADGTPRVWDLVTTDVVAELAYHGEPVRDLSWHPGDPAVLVTASFDGTCVRWGPAGEAGGVPVHAGGDALGDEF